MRACKLCLALLAAGALALVIAPSAQAHLSLRVQTSGGFDMTVTDTADTGQILFAGPVPGFDNLLISVGQSNAKDGSGNKAVLQADTQGTVAKGFGTQTLTVTVCDDTFMFPPSPAIFSHNPVEGNMAPGETYDFMST